MTAGYPDAFVTAVVTPVAIYSNCCEVVRLLEKDVLNVAELPTAQLLAVNPNQYRVPLVTEALIPDKLYMPVAPLNVADPVLPTSPDVKSGDPAESRVYTPPTIVLLLTVPAVAVQHIAILVTVIVSVAYNTHPTQVFEALFPIATAVDVIAPASVGAFQP
jgi:hypothetical protein